MRYDNVRPGRFLARPNRFIAQVELDGKTVDCHLKNTSRLWELLLPGVPTAVQERPPSPTRKTRFDLIAVAHGELWVNIDSQAPNRVFAEWLAGSGHLGPAPVLRAEVPWGGARLDFYIEAAHRRIYAEVKGVTLVEAGVARFPGAPTLRGVKHLQALEDCLNAGFEALAVFIVQRGDVRALAPNDAMHPAYGQALRHAAARGVRLLALDCDVAPGSITARRQLDVLL